MTVTAWDPGDTTGYAVWDEAGNLLEMGQCDLEEIPAIWRSIRKHYGEISTAVVEDFMLFAKRARSQVGSRMKAPQGIGMVKALAASDGAKLVLQKADIKSIAIKWFQITIPSDHSQSHKYDAFLHGSYWLKNEGRIKTVLELQKEAERGDAAQG